MNYFDLTKTTEQKLNHYCSRLLELESEIRADRGLVQFADLIADRVLDARLEAEDCIFLREMEIEYAA